MTSRKVVEQVETVSPPTTRCMRDEYARRIESRALAIAEDRVAFELIEQDRLSVAGGRGRGRNFGLRGQLRAPPNLSRRCGRCSAESVGAVCEPRSFACALEGARRFSKRRSAVFSAARATLICRLGGGHRHFTRIDRQHFPHDARRHRRRSTPSSAHHRRASRSLSLAVSRRARARLGRGTRSRRPRPAARRASPHRFPSLRWRR